MKLILSLKVSDQMVILHQIENHRIVFNYGMLIVKFLSNLEVN